MEETQVTMSWQKRARSGIRDERYKSALVRCLTIRPEEWVLSLHFDCLAWLTRKKKGLSNDCQHAAIYAKLTSLAVCLGGDIRRRLGQQELEGMID